MKDKLDFINVFELLKYHFVFLGLVVLSLEPILITIASILVTIISLHSIFECSKRFKAFQQWKIIAKEDDLMFDIGAFYSNTYNWYFSGSGALRYTKKYRNEMISKKMKEWK